MPEEIVQPPRDDPSEALMREVGAQLREVRRERGEDLDEIAEYLRIRPVYLHGIERGDMSVMPGRTYALGFLRTYADYLGFDGEDLIEQIKSTVDDLTGKTRFHIRAPLHESRLPKMPLLVLSFAMLAGIYAGWTWLNRDDGSRFDQLPPLPEQVEPVPDPAGPSPEPTPEPRQTPAQTPEAPPRQEPPERADGQATAEPAAPPDEADASPEPGDDASATDQAAAPPGPAQPATGEGAVGSLAELSPEAGPDRATSPSRPAGDGRPAAGGAEPSAQPRGDEVGELIAELEDPAEAAGDDVAAAGRVGSEALDPAAEDTTSGAAPEQAAAAVETVLEAAEAGDATVHETVNADARVILRALGQSWMQIRSTSGDYLRTRTLEAGDSFFVPNRNDLVLWTGNAGAIEFLVDGERIAPLGPEGQVIRDVPLEPSALLERAGVPE